jgi:uncharacterized protein (TIGR00251 family)
MLGVIRDGRDGVRLAVHLVPRASRTEIVGIHGQALRIRVSAPPVAGAANAALVSFVAESLGIRKANLEIVSGTASRHKVLRIVGLTREEVQRWVESVAERSG